MAKKLNRGLGAVAALGALSYHLSRGNKRTDGGAPVEDRMLSKRDEVKTPPPEKGAAGGAGSSVPKLDYEAGDNVRIMSDAEREGLRISPGEAAAMSGRAVAPAPARAPAPAPAAARAPAPAPAAARAVAPAPAAAPAAPAPAAGSMAGPGAKMIDQDEVNSRLKAFGGQGTGAGAGASNFMADDPGNNIRIVRPAARAAAGAGPAARPAAGSSDFRASERANTRADEQKEIARMKKIGEAQALQPVYPEALLPVGKGLKAAFSGLKSLFGRDESPPFLKELGGPSRQQLPAPQKAIAGPSRADLVKQYRESRAAQRQEDMRRENAANYGLNPGAPGYDAAAKALRDRLGGSDFTLKKKGGAIKAKKMASGGMTSASSRGDGIASKGKTKGRIY